MAHLCKLVHCATKVQRVVWRDNARYLRARSKHTGADTCSAVQGCPVFEGTFWYTHSPLSLHTLLTASSVFKHQRCAVCASCRSAAILGARNLTINEQLPTSADRKRALFLIA